MAHIKQPTTRLRALWQTLNEQAFQAHDKRERFAFHRAAEAVQVLFPDVIRAGWVKSPKGVGKC